MTREQEIAERLGKAAALDADIAYLLAENARLRGLAVPAQVDLEAIRERVQSEDVYWGDDGNRKAVAVLLAEVDRLRQLCGLLLSDNPDDRVQAAVYETAMECCEVVEKEYGYLTTDEADSAALQESIRRRFGLE